MPIVAGEPATLLGKQRYLAVIKHDGEAILIERGVVPQAPPRSRYGHPVPFPLLPIEAHIIVHAPFALQVRLPLKAKIDVLGVVCGLHPHTNGAVLASDRRGFQVAAFDKLFATGLLAAFVAGETRLSLAYQLGAGVGGTDQPLVSRQPRIEQRDRFRRNFRPVDALRLDGKCRTDKSQRKTIIAK